MSDRDWNEAERRGIELTDEERYEIAMGWKTIEQVMSDRGIHQAEELTPASRHVMQPGPKYEASADEILRNQALQYMNGGMDTSFDTFAQARTAGIPRQYSEQGSAQAAQMASNGLSGSGLANRAQRNNKLDENDATNAGMAQARGDYQQGYLANRKRAVEMLASSSDTKAQREAAAALERANRANENATRKGGAQNAYEFIGGIRNGMSGDNGVF